ncbi:uncharacterized protein SEPMUDRAFT_15305, partial [Sphaerulina musiva SO2202]
MDDWQDAALSNRHLHNRVGKHGRGKGGKSNGAFNVQKTFGTYELKCPAAARIPQTAGEGEVKGKSPREPRLEVYNLNELGNALVGEMVLPGAVHGTVLLAGSRKTLKMAERAVELQEEVEPDEEQDDVEAGEKQEEHKRESSEDDWEQQRYHQFEKNSFRNPKFWLRWQGYKESHSPGGQHEVEVLLTGSGYLVFSGNNCEKFDATLSCDALGWDNIKLKGWKARSHSARDFQISW